METCNSICQSFKLCPPSWDVGWSLDSVHQPLLIIFDTRAAELAFSVTSVRISHINLPLGRHQILKHLGLGLISLLLLLSFDFRQVWVTIVFRLLGRLLCNSLPSLRLLRPLIVSLAWFVIIVVFFKPLVGNVVVRWSVFHQAVN